MPHLLHIDSSVSPRWSEPTSHIHTQEKTAMSRRRAVITGTASREVFMLRWLREGAGRRCGRLWGGAQGNIKAPGAGWWPLHPSDLGG
jgi:hypothetical protein